MKIERHAVGIVGTGFVARGLARAIRRSAEFLIGSVLTRRKESNIPGFNNDEIVSSIDALVEKSEIIVECSGDPLFATNVIEQAIAAGLKVVTMNSAWHVIAGSYYRSRGYITEAEGDQPGSLAALAEDSCAMGFDPLVYINVKRFLNLAPTQDEMSHFSKLYGITLGQVISFTDGTKLQLEQALVANFFGADICKQGMIGPAVKHIDEGLAVLGKAAEGKRGKIVDYVLTEEASGAVMILAIHDHQESVNLRYLKMGDGPLYRLIRPYHLCHLEILKTLRRSLTGGGILLDNGPRPAISVAAIAKRRLLPGEQIEHGIGSFDVRGECIRIVDNAGHLPLSLMQNVTVRRKIEEGEIVMIEDVEIPESLALRAWLATEKEAVVNRGENDS